MAKQERLREAKQHGAAWFPFNIYPCTIPKDFPQVALHWQDSMELVFVKKGRGIVQAGLTTYTAQAGDIYVFAPGVLHALRQLPGEAMEYENIIFELELLGGAGDICAEKYLLPLQSGRLALPMRLGPEDWGYNWAVRCLHAAEEFNKIKDVGYELCIKGELLLFLAALARTLYLPRPENGRTLHAAALAAFCLCLCWELPRVLLLLAAGFGGGMAAVLPELLSGLALCCIGGMGLACIGQGKAGNN